jgi:AcrR family transcriptional regulator
MKYAARQPASPGSQAGSDRVLEAAYELFVRRGVHDVGVDEIIARAGVAKATFYRHFNSKEDLIVAFLRRREQLWTHGWLEQEVLKREQEPRKRLLAVFDVLDEWFQKEDFEGCPFVTTVVQSTDPKSRIRKEAVGQLAIVRRVVRKLAREAKLPDPDGFSRSWQVLMEGAIISALAGDLLAARHARVFAEMMLAALSGSAIT